MTERVVSPQREHIDKVSALAENSAVPTSQISARSVRDPYRSVIRSVENLPSVGRNAAQHLMHISQDWERKSRQFILHRKRDQPLQVLGMVAAGAFALGLIIGFQRFSHHE